MKPKKKTELIRVDYWDCGNQNHRHKTEAVASACLEKRANRAGLTNGARKWTADAYAAVLKQYRDGARLCELARGLGITSTRVRQVLNKAEKLELAGPSSNRIDKLSVRTRNCLQLWNLDTVEAVRAAMADGSIKEIPNIGKVSFEEIQQWLDGLT